MKKKIIISGGVMGLALSSLLVLPGCSILALLKKHFSSDAKVATTQNAGASNAAVKDGTPTLLSIDGKPVITEKTFNEYFEQFVASNPRLQSMIQFMPNAKKEIFDGMVNERLLLAWGEKNNIHEDSEYQKELEQGMRMMKMGLAAKKFEKDIIGKMTVTDKEMHEYYDAHKDPELLVAPGGIKAQGVEFESQDKAQAFFESVKSAPTNFNSAAKGKKVKDFAPINQQSFDVAKSVKDKILSLQKFPSVVMAKADDNKYWVVVALSKEKAQYRSFDEVKEGLSKMIEREKAMKIYSEKMGELKKKYNVEENATYFEQNMPAMPQMPSAEEPVKVPAEAMTGAAKSL